jgi:hypothetical protein
MTPSAPAPPEPATRPRVAVLHGPDARPVTPNGPVRPFHGIASAGLLPHLPLDGGREWARWAPALDPALEGDEEALGIVPPGVVEAARSCGWTSFADGTRAARTFAEGELDALLEAVGAGFGSADVARIELWQVKEGQRSSVWRLSATPAGGGEPARAALNVARDRVAGDELLRGAARLEQLREVAPERVARVLGVECGGGEPPVVAQEWIDDARELAFLRIRRDGRVRLHAVDRFVTDEREPGRIAGVVGERLGAAEHAAAAYEATRILVAGAERLPQDRVAFPRMDVNRGDWVWTERGPVLIAVGSEPERMQAARALDHVLNLWPERHSVRDPEGRNVLRRAAAAALRDARPGASDRPRWG